MSQGTPCVGAFKDTDTLVLSPAKNGGWIVTANGSFGAIGEAIGAFTNAADMIAALSAALCTGAAHD